MKEIEEFLIEQIEDYKEEREEIGERIKECRKDIEYEEDILEDIENFNLYDGIVEGLSIALQKIKEVESMKM